MGELEKNAQEMLKARERKGANITKNAKKIATKHGKMAQIYGIMRKLFQIQNSNKKKRKIAKSGKNYEKLGKSLKKNALKNAQKMRKTAKKLRKAPPPASEQARAWATACQQHKSGSMAQVTTSLGGKCRPL